MDGRLDRCLFEEVVMSNDVAKRIAEIRAELRRDADAISERYNGAPVAVIVAGSKKANVPQTITVFSELGEGREARMRDQLGILQAAIQIESLKHLLGGRMKQQHNAINRIAEAINLTLLD